MKQTKTYAEETNDDIIAELKDLLKQQQILINRLEYKLKEKGKIDMKRAENKTEQITPRPEPHQVSVLDEEIPSEKDEDGRKPF